MPENIVTMALTVWRDGPDHRIRRLRELVRGYARAASYQLDPGLLEADAVQRATSTKETRA
jgi:hypothetical protein